MDKIVLEGIKTLRQNAGLVPPNCLLFADSLICSQILACDDTTYGEAVPLLPCLKVCQDFWSSQYCGSVASLYYNYILKPAGATAKDSSFPFCAGGTFTEEPFPPDVFGGRAVPNYFGYPAGLLGVLRYPASTYAYQRVSGGPVTLTCRNIPKPVDYIPITTKCAFPLKPLGGACVVPCPYPVYNQDESFMARTCFIVPGVVALALCAFVLFDSFWVIFEATGGDVGNFMRKYGLIRNTNAMSSANDMTSGVGGSQMMTSRSGDGSRKTQLRASTLYALLGAALGIIYFCLGPLISLIKGGNVSCAPGNDFFNLGDAANATSPVRDIQTSACRAQRVVPFVLQAIFNLILYAMVKVLLVVSNKSKDMSDAQKIRVDIALVAYCALYPILNLIISTQIDGLSTNLELANVQISRQAIICVMRFENTGIEFALIFLPYILTGVFICYLCFWIFRHLRTVQLQVAGLQANAKQRTASDTALRLLLIRLGFLGVGTFIVLVILMATTGVVMNGLGIYGPAFEHWFACEAAARSCESCDSWKVTADAALPPIAAIGVQLFMMSSIALLFGLFFGAQSASRLWKEYSDGSLQRKIDNLWYGNAMHGSSFASGGGPGSDGKAPTVKGGSVNPEASVAVAAYMEGS